MNKNEFYKYYLPALVKALKQEIKSDEYYIAGPESFLEVSDDKKQKIDLFLDKTAGKNEFLDNVAYYFDALSHNANCINGISIKIYKNNLEVEILKLKKKYRIA